MKPNFLYDLLPAVYRQRDTEHGFALRAFVHVLQSQLDLLHADIGRLYDDWFIETCSDWVVPYLGDLLYEGDGVPSAANPRRLVANTIAYRRRKGTAATLENAIFDATGWPAKVEELGRSVAQTAHLGHLHPGTAKTAGLRPRSVNFRGALPGLAHTADLREGARRFLGRVGIHLWTLPTRPFEGALAKAIAPARGQWCFHPLGWETPLAHHPLTPARPLRTALDPPEPLTLSSPPESLPRLWREGFAADECPRSACDLAGWVTPPGFPPGAIAIDPRRGRFLLPPALRQWKGAWLADWAGFASGDVGGGAYPRPPQNAVHPDQTWRGRVGSEASEAGAEPVYPSLRAALVDWSASGQPGHILLPENIALEEDVTIDFRQTPAGSLTIEAPGGVTAVIRGGWAVTAGAAGAQLSLAGLWLDGSLVCGGPLKLELAHCTLPPTQGPSIALQPAPRQPAWDLVLEHCATGPLALPPHGGGVTIRQSIIDGAGSTAIDHPAVLKLEASTVFGSVAALEAERVGNSIITGPLRIQRAAARAIHHSYFPPGSETPGRYECLPAAGIESAAALAAGHGPMGSAPIFKSRAHTQPGYARLARACPRAFFTGADDGDEMGAFHGAGQAMREARLAATLDEYLPLGLTPLFLSET